MKIASRPSQSLFAFFFRVISLLAAGDAFAQTTYFWRSEATSGNWNVGSHWFRNSDNTSGNVPPGSEIISFNNSAFTLMTNDLLSTNRFRINFISTDSRTINGTTANTFFDFTGQVPAIYNESGNTQTINFKIINGNSNGANRFELNAFSGALVFGGDVSASGGTRTTAVMGSSNVTINGTVMQETGATHILRHEGTGTLFLNGNNTYTGGTTLVTSGATIALGHDNALGTGQLTVSAPGNIFASGAARTIANNVSLSGASLTFTGSNSLTINGTLTGGDGINRAFNNTATAGGAILTLAGNVYISANQATSRTLTLGNTATTGSAGTTTLVTGSIANNSGTNTLASNLEVGGGALVILAGNNTYTGTTLVRNAGTELRIGNGGTTGNLGTGNVTVTTGKLSFNRSNAMTVANNISGTGSLQQMGSGATTLTGTNSYTGTTTVSSGQLFINGNQSAANGAVNVNSGGTTLGGSGITGGAVTVASGSNLSPGATGVGSTAVFGTGALSLQTNSIFNVDLNNTTVGTGYDQVSVTGTVGVSGSDLMVTAGGGLMLGDKFFIVANDGVDAVTGLFADGATTTSGAYVFAINYADNFPGSGLGNDISLTVTAVPEPSTWFAGGLAFAALAFGQRRRLKRLLVES